MSGCRCELLSADQLATLASGPLPGGVLASEARRSLHRDLYLDTDDDSLRRRGIVCRLRTRADGTGRLVLEIPAAGNANRVEADTDGADVVDALRSNSVVVRHLRGVVDPSALQVRVDLEVDRLTRSALRDWLGRPRLLVHLDRITVRRSGAGASATFFQMCAHQRGDNDADVRALERALEHEHGVRASRMDVRERGELAIKWARLDDATRNASAGYSDRLHRAIDGRTAVGSANFFNSELSLLSFQHRVLALAENGDTPLGERLRFLAIVSANVDEFFMVRMAGLSEAVGETNEEQAEDGLTPSEQLAAIHESVSEITARQGVCLRRCWSELSQHGVHLRRWSDLTASQQAELASRFRDDIQPLLTPFAMTLSPGHPLPRLSHLSLAIATVVRNRNGGPPRFAELELPRGVPRFFHVNDAAGRAVVTLEELVRANLESMYPDSALEHAFAFRVTRSAELDLDEAHADDLLDEVARAVSHRGDGTAVRLEVERGMPGILRALLLEDLRREHRGEAAGQLSDVEEIESFLDMSALTQLEIPDSAPLRYPPFAATDPFAGAPSTFAAIDHGDVMVHHPFESFAGTVTRFIRDAADDPAVLAIKMTLYRVGDPSPIADALLDAARGGKAVTAFIELKARFDENVNVGWARALEAAGGHVVRGLVGYKNHAKVALVVRREGEALRRYVHIGTGNYNSRSGEQYTDLSLFTTDDVIAADVADLFNDLTGASEPQRRAPRALLVAPHHLLSTMIEQIDREAAHARAGRPARITAKFNGLSDPDVVRALYRASQDGVPIELIVRGICTLVPGVTGRSERIRVLSVAGRFLEHSRIYRFANGGDARYFIGSADLRPRNLRRRVELLAPIGAEQHRRTLDDLLSRYLSDPLAWELDATGSYARRAPAEARGVGS